MTVNRQNTLSAAGLDLKQYIEGMLTLEDEPDINEPGNQAIELIDVPVVETAEVKQEQSASLPGWASQPFDCLHITIANKSFLIPAVHIAYVEKVDRTLTRLPLEKPSFMGILGLRQRSVAVINLLTLIIGNEELTRNDKQISEHFVDHVIVMQDSRYAIACDSVGRMHKMESDMICWNGSSSNHPCYHGIARDHLYPLININEVDRAVAAMPFVQSFNREQA